MEELGEDYDELLSPIMRASPGAGGAGGGGGSASNFSVVIRVRPPLERELHGDRPFENVVRVGADARSIVLSENLAALDSAPDGGGGEGSGLAPVAASAVGPYATHAFTFDHLYDMHADQRRVFETTAKSVVESALAGYNATIFAVRDWEDEEEGRVMAEAVGSLQPHTCLPSSSFSVSLSLPLFPSRPSRARAVRADGHGQDVHYGGLQLRRGARHHPARHRADLPAHTVVGVPAHALPGARLVPADLQ